jgi:hypothetical protein
MKYDWSSTPGIRLVRLGLLLLGLVRVMLRLGVRVA